MDEETIEPKHIELVDASNDYVVTLIDINEEVIEEHRFGKDLLGAVICAQRLQNKWMHKIKNWSVIIDDFPLKHPNQTTLDEV